VDPAAATDNRCERRFNRLSPTVCRHLFVERRPQTLADKGACEAVNVDRLVGAFQTEVCRAMLRVHPCTDAPIGRELDDRSVERACPAGNERRVGVRGGENVIQRAPVEEHVALEHQHVFVDICQTEKQRTARAGDAVLGIGPIGNPHPSEHVAGMLPDQRFEIADDDDGFTDAGRFETPQRIDQDRVPVHADKALGHEGRSVAETGAETRGEYHGAIRAACEGFQGAPLALTTSNGRTTTAGAGTRFAWAVA
jgi:hypothetical protein